MDQILRDVSPAWIIHKSIEIFLRLDFFEKLCFQIFVFILLRQFSTKYKRPVVWCAIVSFSRNLDQFFEAQFFLRFGALVKSEPVEFQGGSRLFVQPFHIVPRFSVYRLWQKEEKRLALIQ